MMKQSTILRTLAAALLGWVGVGAYGIWEISKEESGDGWQRPYFLFSVSLLLARLIDSARPETAPTATRKSPATV